MPHPLAPPESGTLSPAWWWENAPKWSSEERRGGYLWASQREPGGSLATRGAMLTHLAPGDRVLRASWNAIFTIAVVRGSPVRALPPRALGISPNHRSSWGYRVPVEFVPLSAGIEVRQIPRAWRAAIGGPFKPDGGIRKSRLYPLPEPFVSWLLERFASEIPAGLRPRPPLPDTHTAAWRELYRQTLEGFFPDATTCRMSLDFLAESIITAHEHAPGSWTTALPDRHLFRMNVAKIEVCVLQKDSLYLVLDKDALKPADRDVLGETASPLPESGVQYRSTPFAHGFTLPAHRVVELLPHARDAHLALVGRAARTTAARSGYANVHQPQFIDYLQATLGRDLPQPDYSHQEEPELDNHEPEHAWLSGEWQTAWLLNVPPAVGSLDDLLAESRVGDASIWPVTRYWDQMQRGQPVILWQGGTEPGIYAIGELDDAPFESASGDWEVPIRYSTLLDEPLPVEALRARPALRELASLPEPEHTICKVPDSLWAALQPLLPESPA
ncbi:MAG: EVE domain-containing protein [Chloroflexota bacterium]|nr:EVE domain-containing protein [Chloroflexota bacterium]